MYDFHVSIHARGEATAAGPLVTLRGVPCHTVSPDAAASFDATFEQAAEAFSRLPRMLVEPDGSLVWAGGDGLNWQLDGVLYDRGGRLRYVELKGRCPPQALDRLLACLGWPGTAVVFQLTRQGVCVPEDDFRRWAAAAVS